jgi:hypothetical protein
VNFTREEREELNTLSKEVLGKSSKWRNTGYKKGVRKPKEERTIGASDYKWLLTFEDVKAWLLQVKDAKDKLLAEMKAKATETKVDG